MGSLIKMVSIMLAIESFLIIFGVIETPDFLVAFGIDYTPDYVDVERSTHTLLNQTGSQIEGSGGAFSTILSGLGLVLDGIKFLLGFFFAPILISQIPNMPAIILLLLVVPWGIFYYIVILTLIRGGTGE